MVFHHRTTYAPYNHDETSRQMSFQPVVASSAKSRFPKRKPRDRPKRPLSAYNFFFKVERERVLKICNGEQKLNEQDEKDGPEITADEIERVFKDSKVSFEEMGKVIGRRWKTASEEQLAKYNAMASKDTERYKKEMAEYNVKQEAKIKAEAQAQASAVTYPPPPQAPAYYTSSSQHLASYNQAGYYSRPHLNPRQVSSGSYQDPHPQHGMYYGGHYYSQYNSNSISATSEPPTLDIHGTADCRDPPGYGGYGGSQSQYPPLPSHHHGYSRPPSNLGTGPPPTQNQRGPDSAAQDHPDANGFFESVTQGYATHSQPNYSNSYSPSSRNRNYPHTYDDRYPHHEEDHGYAYPSTNDEYHHSSHPLNRRP